MNYFISTSAINVPLAVVFPQTTNMTHFVSWIIASYSLVPVAGRLLIKTGTTAIFDCDIFIQNPAPIIFPDEHPLNAVQSDPLEISLAAGGLLNMGKLNVFGYSIY